MGVDPIYQAELVKQGYYCLACKKCLLPIMNPIGETDITEKAYDHLKAYHLGMLENPSDPDQLALWIKNHIHKGIKHIVELEIILDHGSGEPKESRKEALIAMEKVSKDLEDTIPGLASSVPIIKASVKAYSLAQDDKINWVPLHVRRF